MLPPSCTSHGWGGREAWAGTEGASSPPQTFLRPGSNDVTRDEGRRGRKGERGEKRGGERMGKEGRRKGLRRRKEWESREKEEEEDRLGTNRLTVRERRGHADANCPD